MSILVRMQQQRQAAKEVQVKPQELSQNLQAQIQQAGLQLIQNGVSQGQQAGYNGQVVKPQERKQEPLVQGA